MSFAQTCFICFSLSKLTCLVLLLILNKIRCKIVGQKCVSYLFFTRKFIPTFQSLIFSQVVLYCSRLRKIRHKTSKNTLHKLLSKEWFYLSYDLNNQIDKFFFRFPEKFSSETQCERPLRRRVGRERDVEHLLRKVIRLRKETQRRKFRFFD